MSCARRKRRRTALRAARRRPGRIPTTVFSSTRASSPACPRAGAPGHRRRSAAARHRQAGGELPPARLGHLAAAYWGTPIPIIYWKDDPESKGIPVPDDQLPVTLPDIDVREVLNGLGEPPWRRWPVGEHACPRCGGPARREAETMDTFVDSTWYWARYLDPRNDGAPFSRAKADRWLPWTSTSAGPSTRCCTCCYFRFWTKVMQELGCAPSTSRRRSSSPRASSRAATARRCPSPRATWSRRARSSSAVRRGHGAALHPLRGARGEGHGLVRRAGAGPAPLPRPRLAPGALVASEVASARAGGGDGAADELRRRTHKTILEVTQQLERLQFNTAISS